MNMKKYKECPPLETVQKIRNILFDNKLFLQEIQYNNSKLFKSGRVYLSSDELQKLNIGTGGKGTSYEYSLASAYAEFMERIQNSFLISGQKYAIKNNLRESDYEEFYNKLENKDLFVEYLFDPREKKINIEESVRNNKKIFFDFFPFINDEQEMISFLRDNLNFKQVVSVPFYSFKERNEIYLPLEIIHITTGSNGMASGNTQYEALIQGFCEIFERYVGRELYYNNITPPDIQLDFFKDTRIYNSIKSIIKDCSYEVIIKDCSLGKNLPVIGVLIIDRKNGKYNFNLGSSLNPEIALERCLTEIYQNPKGIHWLDLKFETDFKNLSEEYIYVNGNLIFNCSNGYWPISLFSASPDYQFKGLNTSLNISDVEDLEFIKNKITELGFDIYIRDVSFLGFPSYYIVVPGMSQFPMSKKHYFLFGDSVEALRKMRDIRNINNNEFVNIAKSINKDYNFLKMIDYKTADIFLYNTDEDLLELDLELLFFMINYKVGNYEYSLKYINLFLENKDFSIYKYYFAIRDFIVLKNRHHNNLDIKSLLAVKYGQEIATEIIEDVGEPEKIFDNYEWTSCFHCEKCELINSCMYFDVLSIIKRMQQKQKKFTPNYNMFDFENHIFN